MSLLEQMVLKGIVGPEPTLEEDNLDNAKKTFYEAVKPKTTQEIEQEASDIVGQYIERIRGVFVDEPIPDFEEPTKQGWEFWRNIDDEIDEAYTNWERDVRDRIRAENNRNSGTHEAEQDHLDEVNRTEYEDRLKEQIDAITQQRRDLYDQTLSFISDSKSENRDPDFRTVDARNMQFDEAEFLESYVRFRQELRNGDVDSAIDKLEKLIESDDKHLSENPDKLEFLKLEQAQIYTDRKRFHKRAGEIISTVSINTTNGLAGQVAGEIYTKLDDFKGAAIAYHFTYLKHPSDESKGKIVDSLRSYIRQGSVTNNTVPDVVALVDEFMNIPNSTKKDYNIDISSIFTEEDKNSLLVEEARFARQEGNSDYAIEILTPADDAVTNGQKSYITGEIYIEQRNFTKAAEQFRNAYDANHSIAGLTDKIKEIFEGHLGEDEITEAATDLQSFVDLLYQ